MRTLSEDLVLLATVATIEAGPERRTLGRIRTAVSGSELVRLIAEPRIDVVDKHIVVLNPVPTGDPLLDAALADIGAGGQRADLWVRRERPHLTDSYLTRLTEAGVLWPERGRFLGLPTTKWVVADPAHVAEVRGRLDAIAGSAPPIDVGRAVFAALVHLAGLESRLYRGRGDGPARQRIVQLARRARSERTAAPADRAIVAAVNAAFNAAGRVAVPVSREATANGY